MSDIKIQPSATGSATVTLTAPATGTARTVTLPDSTDTLAVNSDVTNKLPLAGGTLTGNLNIGSYTANSNADNLVIQEAGDFTGITLAADNDQGSNIYFADPEDNNVGGITYNHSSNDLRFRVNGAEKARILSGGGITFNGDTAAANALDDYEEGTWTPNIGGNATYTNQVGNYIKIGNLVWAHFSMTINVKGTGNSMGAIYGLPFQSGYASQNSAAMQWANLATAINHGTYYVGANSTTLYFSYHTGSATGLSNNPNIWANGATMIGVHIYSST
jgi:hypothetical protein